MKNDDYDSKPVSLVFAKSLHLPTLRAAYSDRTAALMAALSQNAYIPFKQLRKRRKRGAVLDFVPEGQSLLEARLAEGGFELVRVFNSDDVQAFLATRHDMAVLAFRGTATLRDWRTDLNQGLLKLKEFKGVRIHRGFWKAFETAQADIVAAVDGSVPSSIPLYITGHSLGGAFAQIASAVLERDNLAACYTFGSPRVATLEFDRDVKCPHYRVINAWDLVPGLPAPFGSYRHSGDPRLLAPKAHGQNILRRDRLVIASLCVNLWSMAVSLVSRRLSVVDDHMIWNYRRQLDAIARARNTADAAGDSPSRPA
ncbi:MAG: lipase family protein [Asticcacaulis sp.]